MKGTRVELPSDNLLILKEGEYCKFDGVWYAKPPGFKSGYANLSNHKVVEHEDETITVSPSIKVETHLQKWHGYLEKGIWRSC